MAQRKQRRRSLSVINIVARVVGYFAIGWATLAVLAASAFRGGAWVVLAIAAYTMIPLLVFLRWRGWPFYPGTAFRLLVVRPFWYAQLMLPLVAGAGLLGMLAGLPFGHALFFGRVFAVVVGALVIVLLLAGYLGSRRLVVRHVDVDVPDLPASFDGLRIVQLSDLHIGPHTPRAFIERIVETTRALRPDLLAITGDLIDDRAEDVAVYARTIGALDAPLGVYMIPGNHDVYAGWDEVERSLRAAEIGTLLVNESRVIRRGGDSITLVGTGDPAGGRAGFRGAARVAPDIPRAMALVDDDATVIAFAHNPALWPSLAEHGVALTLSGHTHWGQFALPHLGWSLASPFLEHAMGAHRENDSVLYISPGTGYWGIPFRLGASPEVTLVTLRRGDVAGAQVHRARAA